ncbi:Hpt domain-containing protein [Kordiimonas aestuarii]|uniref:Hpt domain-containing protein n=1 Tax=Kordiimonas aestuarii TaxID=1005925 RepID=UPI0021CEE995|nr:Hpt domain-containing protein [Kordiimonas aestuarii]
MGGQMPLLDQPTLDKLTADVGEESAAFLIGSLKQEIERTGSALAEHALKGELEQVEIQAHALKSAARSFGAMRLGETCLAIEEAARAARAPEMEGLISRFRLISAETIAAFG